MSRAKYLELNDSGNFLFEYVMEWVAMGVERKAVYTAASGARRWHV